jgi:hypothetical protein
MEYSVGNITVAISWVIILQDCSKVVVWVATMGSNGFLVRI